MNDTDFRWQLLLRYLDGRLSPDEKIQVPDLLRSDPQARVILREVAEQAVMVAELERTEQSRLEELRARPASPKDPSPSADRSVVSRVRFNNWQWPLAAAAVIALLGTIIALMMPSSDPGIVRVAKVAGSNQYFGSNGQTGVGLQVGSFLEAGDMIETRSCDAWLELQLREGSTITIAGHSQLRILETNGNGKRFDLLQGNFWASVAPRPDNKLLRINTPTAEMEVLGTQFDIQTSASATMLRVNEGSVRVARLVDGGVAVVRAGQQVVVSLSRREGLAVTPQPTPVNYWTCELLQISDVKLGKPLPPRDGERARLGAEPLLWPIPGRDPLMLYAVALSVWGNSEQPVLLQFRSILRIRGRTERAQRVRFGFSTQKMRGVFAGKFEVDVESDSLGPVGETWEIDLPIEEFRPLHRHLSPSPDGLELNDIYALTIEEDAGLEINRVELLPTAPLTESRERTEL